MTSADWMEPAEAGTAARATVKKIAVSWVNYIVMVCGRRLIGWVDVCNGGGEVLRVREGLISS